jgi:hypothetical protein
MEVEYIMLSEAGCNATWLRNLYGKLRFIQTKLTVIKGDNDGSAIDILLYWYQHPSPLGPRIDSQQSTRD